MKRTKLSFLVGKFAMVLMVATVLMLNSCSGGPKPNPENPIKTIAVLPMTNMTNSVGGAEKVRKFMAKSVVSKFYEVKNFQEIDQVLMNQLGITMGEMAEDSTPADIGNALGVDGVLYGYLVDFGGVTTGLINEDKVRAGFKLVNVKTGEVAWQQAVGVKSSSSAGKFGDIARLASNLKDTLKKEEINKDIRGAEKIPGFNTWVMNDEGKTSGFGGGSLANIGISMAAKLIEKGVAKATDTYLNPECRKLASELVWMSKNSLPSGPVDKDTTKANSKAFKKAN